MVKCIEYVRYMAYIICFYMLNSPIGLTTVVSDSRNSGSQLDSLRQSTSRLWEAIQNRTLLLRMSTTEVDYKRKTEKLEHS